MAPPPPLVDDVVGEILLRLPPDEPENLFRAALICKTWLRIICDPGFRRRYRAFHGAPPLLGLLMVPERDTEFRFASTTSIPSFRHPPSDGWRTRLLDCRHGRILIEVLHGRSVGLVWDPVTGDRHELPKPDIDWHIYSAAVLCAADGCDHLDCHGGPFRVVVVFAGRDSYARNLLDSMLASVYSSETGAWSVPVCLDRTCGFHVMRRHVLVGGAIYFTARPASAIVKYDLRKDRLSMIEPPPVHELFVALMAMENNTSLGFACFQGFSLYTWSMKVDTEEAAEWVQYRVIDLQKTIPVANSDKQLFLIGSAEGVDVIFVSSGVGLFMIKLNSGQVKTVHESGLYFSVLPYMSFYTPDRGRLLSSLARTD